MYDYYLYYFGIGNTEPALYRVDTLTGHVTYSNMENKILNFSWSANSKADVLAYPKDFIKLK